MDGETESPADGPPPAGMAVLTLVWLALSTGLAVMTAALGLLRAAVAGEPPLNPPEVGYAFLLAVPAGLAVAFVLLPGMWRSPPAEETPAGWFGAYQAAFIARAAVVEGAGVLTAAGFFLSGLWPVLFGPVVMLAALVGMRPGRAGYEAWVEGVRRRTDG